MMLIIFSFHVDNFSCQSNDSWQYEIFGQYTTDYYSN